MFTVYLRCKVQILLIGTRRVFLSAFHDRIYLEAQASFLSFKQWAVPYIFKSIGKPFADAISIMIEEFGTVIAHIAFSYSSILA